MSGLNWLAPFIATKHSKIIPLYFHCLLSVAVVLEVMQIHSKLLAHNIA